ncbi:hypothetical protein GCM10023221_36600 [Luteimicrobium xylanilyticum]
MLNALRQVSATVINTVSGALPDAPTSYPSTDRGKEALRQAGLAWAPVPGLISQMETALSSAATDILAVATNRDLTPEAKSRQVGQLVDTARSNINGLADSAVSAGARVLDVLRAAAYPPRPQPEDAIQEARLAGIKADLRMVLDPVSANGDDLARRLGDLLGRAVADGDDLTTWVLASSHWPDDYLASRGADMAMSTWPSLVSSQLDGITSDTGLRDVRRAYARVSQPQRGIPALEVTLRVAVPSVLGDLQSSPAPFMR